MRYAVRPAIACFVFFASLQATCSMAGETYLTGQQLLDTGKRLSADEIKGVIKPGVSVDTYLPSSGSTRQWVSEASGSFTAFRLGGTGSARSNGDGKWHFDDAGDYCVSIDWKTRGNAPDYTEKWCYALYKVGDELYFAPSKLAGSEGKKYSVVHFK